MSSVKSQSFYWNSRRSKKWAKFGRRSHQCVKFRSWVFHNFSHNKCTHLVEKLEGYKIHSSFSCHLQKFFSYFIPSPFISKTYIVSTSPIVRILKFLLFISSLLPSPLSLSLSVPARRTFQPIEISKKYFVNQFLPPVIRNICC